MAALVFLPLAGFVFITKILTAFGFTVGRISDSFGVLFYDLSFLHFLIGIVAGSRAAGPNLRHGKECPRPPANEVGRVGNGLRRYSVHTALRHRPPVWRLDGSLANGRRRVPA